MQIGNKHMERWGGANHCTESQNKSSLSGFILGILSVTERTKFKKQRLPILSLSGCKASGLLMHCIRRVRQCVCSPGEPVASHPGDTRCLNSPGGEHSHASGYKEEPINETLSHSTVTVCFYSHGRQKRRPQEDCSGM